MSSNGAEPEPGRAAENKIQRGKTNYLAILNKNHQIPPRNYNYNLQCFQDRKQGDSSDCSEPPKKFLQKFVGEPRIPNSKTKFGRQSSKRARFAVRPANPQNWSTPGPKLEEREQNPPNSPARNGIHRALR
jgi:hypothetical protein